jgi:hypothetical protein
MYKPLFNLSMHLTFNRDIVLTKRGQPTTPKEEVEYMCVYEGDYGNIKTHEKGKMSVLTTHYKDNAKCKPNQKFKLRGSRTLECRQIDHEINEKIAGSTVWKTKKITVGCKVVVVFKTQ